MADSNGSVTSVENVAASGELDFGSLKEFSIAQNKAIDPGLYAEELVPPRPEDLIEKTYDPDEHKEPAKEELEEEEETEETEKDLEDDEEETEEDGAEGAEKEAKDDAKGDGTEILKHTKTALRVKDAEGKVLEIPKDAKIALKIDGEWQEKTMSEVRDMASSAIHIDQQVTYLDKGRKALEAKEQLFNQNIETARDRLEAITELAQAGDVLGVCETFCELQGEGNAEQVLAGIITGAVQYAQKLQNMSPRERQLEAENRRYRVAQRLEAKKVARVTKTEGLNREKAQVEQMLKTGNASWDDWMEAAAIAEKDMREGLRTGTVTGIDIAKDAIKLAHEKIVTQAIKNVDKTKLMDAEFKKKVSKALLHEASLSDEPVSLKEATVLVRKALDREKSRISETLGKKSERSDKTLKTTPRKADSRKQEPRAASSLLEHSERMFEEFERVNRRD